MQGDIITNYEAEHFIEGLKAIDINEFGSRKWFAQDEIMQKLNLQAHVNAMVRSDEFIMESCVTFNKVKLLVYDLIMSEMWKQYVLPHMKHHICTLSSIRSYSAVQHEAIVCNILQLILFHRTAVEAADNYLLEVVDYCYRKLAGLIAHPPPKVIIKRTVEYYTSRERIDEFNEQVELVEFQIQMMTLSIIRFITDYIKYLPINVSHQMLVENDLFMLLIPLIEEKPWLRQNSSNEREVYEHSKWTVVPKSEYSKLPKQEAQVWIAIYNMFMDPDSRRKYELTDFKKNNLLRLRKYMNELLLDQIPQLGDMLRSLEELSIMQVQSTIQTAFVVQQMPELRTQICKDRNWKEIALRQQTEYFADDESVKEDMKRYAELYSNAVFEGMVEGFKCEICGREAPKRCSRCKLVWYCSKECQTKHWPAHKSHCAAVKQQNVPAVQQTNITELDKID